MTTDYTTYFTKDIAIEDISRKELIQALIKRHEGDIAPLKKKVKDLKKRSQDLEKKREAAKKERNKVNDEVMTLKQKRQVHHELANEKRREFFILMERLDDLEKLDEEIDSYRNRLEAMEWDLQTTKITASDEKAMIKRIQEIYQQMTAANTEAQQKLGIEQKIASLSSEIGEKLAGAQKYHESLVEQAKESDVHHDEFMASGKELSEIRIEMRKLERRIERHKESLDYWKDWVGGKSA